MQGVTKLSALTFDSSQARQAESIRKMILAMADDIRVILIKLADRLHNMRTLQYHPTAAKQRKISMAALEYLKRTDQTGNSARFDVVAIDTAGGTPAIEVVKNAFALAYG